MQNVKIVNTSKHNLPKYQTVHSAGVDLTANLETPLELEPQGRALVPTGISIQLPEGHEAQIRPRSGLAIKHGIGLLNSPGTIDADYRGEIKVILVNHSNQPFMVEDGMRIAQMVVAKYERVNFETAESLDTTERGSGGFGHTGI